MPPALGEGVSTLLGDRIEPVADAGCAAVEYTDVIKGRRDLSVYYRLRPWDHAAPALVLAEAGGRVEHADGRTYGPRSKDEVTIVARDAATAREVQAWLGGASEGPRLRYGPEGGENPAPRRASARPDRAHLPIHVERTEDPLRRRDATIGGPGAPGLAHGNPHTR